MPAADRPTAPAARPAPLAEPLEQGHSPWQDAWQRLQKNRLAVFGLWALVVVSLACVVGPWLMHFGYEEQNLDLGATRPGSALWLGTVTLGRDLLVRLLIGGRISLAVGLAATLVALTIGVVYGAVAGFIGGKLDGWIT